MDVIAGMPLSSWILLVVSVGLPLTLVIVFFSAHRKERSERGGGPGAGDAGRAGR